MNSAVQHWTGAAAGLVSAIYGSFTLYALSDGGRGFEIPPTINRAAVLLVAILTISWVVMIAVDDGVRRSAERDIRHVVATEVERQASAFERMLDEKLRDLRDSIDRDAGVRSTEDTEEIRVAVVQQHIQTMKLLQRLLEEAGCQNRTDHERILRAMMVSDTQPRPGRAQVVQMRPNGS